ACHPARCAVSWHRHLARGPDPCLWAQPHGPPSRPPVWGRAHGAEGGRAARHPGGAGGRCGSHAPGGDDVLPLGQRGVADRFRAPRLPAPPATSPDKELSLSCPPPSPPPPSPLPTAPATPWPVWSPAP